VQWAVEAENGDVQPYKIASKKASHKGLLVVPYTRLYDKGMLFKHSTMMHERTGDAFALLNPADAQQAKIEDGASMSLTIGELTYEVRAVVSADTPQGVVLLPKRMTDQPS